MRSYKRIEPPVPARRLAAATVHKRVPESVAIDAEPVRLVKVLGKTPKCHWYIITLLVNNNVTGCGVARGFLSIRQTCPVRGRACLGIGSDRSIRITRWTRASRDVKLSDAGTGLFSNQPSRLRIIPSHADNRDRAGIRLGGIARHLIKRRQRSRRSLLLARFAGRSVPVPRLPSGADQGHCIASTPDRFPTGRSAGEVM
jgi:hypothetical protein